MLIGIGGSLAAPPYPDQVILCDACGMALLSLPAHEELRASLNVLAVKPKNRTVDHGTRDKPGRAH